jgi:hypothetical protein
MPYEITSNFSTFAEPATATPDDCSTPVSFSLYGYTGIELQNILPKSNFYNNPQHLFDVGGHSYYVTPLDVNGDNTVINFSITSTNPSMSVDYSNSIDIATSSYYFETLIAFDSANSRVIVEPVDLISANYSYIVINNVNITETPQNITLYQSIPGYQYDEWIEYEGLGFQIDGPPAYAYFTI